MDQVLLKPVEDNSNGYLQMIANAERKRKEAEAAEEARKEEERLRLEEE